MLKLARGQLKDALTFDMVGYLFAAIAFVAIFLWHLGSGLPGLSTAETAQRTASANLHTIFSSPLNAPYKFLEYVFARILPNSSLGLRLASVTVALICALSFYRVVSGWFGRIIGLFGGLIFISLPIFILTGRQGSAEIMYFAPIILIWLYAWLIKTDRPKTLVWAGLLAAVGLLLYIPGMVWWILGAAIICRAKLIAAISVVPQWVSATAFALSAFIISPLVAGLVSHTNLIRPWLLIPDHWSPILDVGKNIFKMFLALFIQTPYHSILILGHLPLLNVLVLALIIFGIYAMQAVARAKAAWLGLSVLFAVLLAGLNNNLSLLAFGLPALGVFMCAGLRYLYIEWRAIFPRNPVPKSFALILIAAVTLAQLYFGIRYALIAWPHSVATRAVYVLK